MNSLQNLAARTGLEFGCSLDVPSMSDPVVAGLVQGHCGVITIDNDAKLAMLRPTPNAINYGPADAIVRWATDRHLRVSAQSLVWDTEGAIPTWVKALSGQQRRDFLIRYIDETSAHFAKLGVTDWVVVNEPIEPANGKADNVRGSAWYDAFGGEEYIVQAFIRARSALGPSARLVLNEALEGITPDAYRRTRSFVALVDRLLDRGLSFEVGIEGHIDSQQGANVERMPWLVEQLTARSLRFRITEFDDNDYWFDRNQPATAAQIDEGVAGQLMDLIGPCLKSPLFGGITTWQPTDKWSQMNRERWNPKREVRCLLFDSAGQPKAAAWALAQAFRAR